MTRTQPEVRHANWAGNVQFAAPMHAPHSVAQVQRLVAGAERVHAVGTGHSFTPVADTRGTLISVAGLPSRVDIAEAPPGQCPQATISAGMTFAQVARSLDAAGLALHNMGSLPHISVAGACSTGTHGSGDRARCLAAAVSGVEMVSATGDLLTIDRSDADFAGVMLSLGSLGIVTALTLDLQPSFAVAQTVWQGVDVATGLEAIDQIMACAYSVSVFTTLSEDGFGDVWVKRRMDEADPDLARWGARRALHPLRPVPGEPAEGCTMQGGIPGPWFERLPHFTPDVPPSSSGAEIQSEYYVSRKHGPAALAALWQIGASLRAAMQICELRTLASDGLWLSPACDADLLGIHFTWHPDPARVAAACQAVEAALADFAPVPHWGKVAFLDPEVVAGRFARIDDARDLVARLDPGNVFGNDFIDPYLRPGR